MIPASSSTEILFERVAVAALGLVVACIHALFGHLARSRAWRLVYSFAVFGILTGTVLFACHCASSSTPPDGPSVIATSCKAGQVATPQYLGGVYEGTTCEPPKRASEDGGAP